MMYERFRSFPGTIMLSLLLLSTLACAGYPVIAQAQNPSEDAKNKSLTVTVKTFEQLAFHPLKKAPAYVVTLQNSLLSAQITAIVDQIHVKVGDQVKQGQLLVALDCDDYVWQAQQLAADKEALKANYEFTQYKFERSQKLIKTKSVSEESHRNRAADLKNLKAKIRALDAKIKKARKNVERCEIVAPYDGVISERSANVGEYVVPSSPLLRLINTDDLEVEVQVPIAVVNQLDYKSLDFVYRDEHFPVSLRAIIPSIETRARHQLVRLEFIDKKALPDAFGMVHVQLKTLELPANVLVQRKGKTGIFIIKKDIIQTDVQASADQGRQKQLQQQNKPMAFFHPITNALIGRPASVELASETLIVVQGRHALEDGQPVNIQKDAQVPRTH